MCLKPRAVVEAVRGATKPVRRHKGSAYVADAASYKDEALRDELWIFRGISL